MKIARLLVVCAMAPLAGCGLSDQYSVMPKLLKQPSAAPAQSEPEPDTKELIRLDADKLFTSHPSALAVSQARRDSSGPGFTACVKAMIARSVGNAPESITLVVSIEHGELADRRRAMPQDRCTAETYENVDVAQ
jgi:hypothetical protein